MSRLKELNERRLRLVAHYRSHVEAVQNRSETAEDREQFARIDAEIGEVDGAIQLEKRNLRASELEFELRRSQGRRIPAVDHRHRYADDDESRDLPPHATAEYEAAFRSWMATGQVESRALRQDDDAAGGYMVAPLSMMAGILKAVDDATPIRGLATKISVNIGISVGNPSLDNDPDDFEWTSELGTGDEDSTMSFGKRELRPVAIAKRIKVSRQLLQNAPAADSFIQSRLGYKIGVTAEKKFMTGDGASQPLGIFTASSNGIPTTRDVVTGSATAVTADSFIDALYNLKAQYQLRARWLMHRDVVAAARKLKTGAGDYLWQPSLTAGEPDMLLGRPIVESEFAPNTFTDGNYAACVGDFRYYYVAEPARMMIQRLNELYAESNQIGFIGRHGVDGMPVLAEAFTRLKFATS